MWRFHLVAATGVAGLVLLAGPIAAQPSPIGPDQSFKGLVNSSADTTIIRMACIGPPRPGQTGRPWGGQTVAVEQSSDGTGGFTGAATKIEAAVIYPTKTGQKRTLLAVFTEYDSPAPISTDLKLPCEGQGRVVFRPLDGGPTAQSDAVRVSFVGQP
jgi:hypothetical protein